MAAPVHEVMDGSSTVYYFSHIQIKISLPVEQMRDAERKIYSSLHLKIGIY
jgi:hypothetical protein